MPGNKPAIRREFLSRFGSGRSEKPDNLRYEALPRRREVLLRRRLVVPQTSKSASKLAPGCGPVSSA
jgi:hypothetical protein